jgi:hypothetical protein
MTRPSVIKQELFIMRYNYSIGDKNGLGNGKSIIKNS